MTPATLSHPARHDYLGVGPDPVKRPWHLKESLKTQPSKTGQNIKYGLIVLRGKGVDLPASRRTLGPLLPPRAQLGKHSLERISLHYLGTMKQPYDCIAGRERSR
jgi:hypothetical protein